MSHRIQGSGEWRSRFGEVAEHGAVTDGQGKWLIKNAIVCWNSLYLTQKIAEAPDAETRTALLESVAAGSAVSWRHINLLGEYDFSDEKLRASVGIRPPKSLALGTP
jgi:hypothetical protein